MKAIDPAYLFETAWRSAEQRELDKRDAPAIAASRACVNAFAEFAFFDDNNEPLIQAAHHLDFQSLANDHSYLVMHYPVEHGKTTQAKIRLIWLLGKHPDRQYAYISSKARQAEKLVAAVGRDILMNPRIRQVFPHLRPAIGPVRGIPEQWGMQAIRVHGCPPGSKDPSLAAYGIDGQILGARVHGAILDNVLDRENTATKLMREKIVDIVENEVFTRALTGGFIHIIDTAWHDDDLLHTFAKRDGWVHRKYDTLDGPGGGLLWPERFSQERLDDIQSKIGQLAFDRMYRNRSLSASTVYFKREFWDMAYGRCQFLDEWPEHEDGQIQLRTGVDLATRKGQEHDLTSFSTVIAKGHRRQLIHMRSGRMIATEILRAIVPIYRMLHAPINKAGGNAKFVVEDNAAQVFIVQMLKDAGFLRQIGLTLQEISDIRVTGRTTTAKKRDPEIGIPALASGLEMGRWDIAPHEETRELREEMRVWSPDAHSGDRLMATWIAASDLTETTADFRVDFIS